MLKILTCLSLAFAITTKLIMMAALTIDGANPVISA